MPAFLLGDFYVVIYWSQIELKLCTLVHLAFSF